MDERRLHDELASLEEAAPDASAPALPAHRRSRLLWAPAALALVAGVLVGFWGSQLLPRQPAARQAATSPVAWAALAAGCPVTRPPDPPFVPSQGPERPPDYSHAFWYGTDALWAMPPADGTWPLTPSDDGWYTQKTFWWSVDFAEREPDITVTGRRLDGDAPAIRTDPPTNASADFGVAMLVGIQLPTPGCWELTATYRGHSLSYVVYVQDQRLEPKVTGLRWTPVSFDEGAEVRALSVVGDRVFATGADRRGAAAWYSDDGGESWTRSETRFPATASIPTNDLTLGRVVAFGNQFVSLGTMALGSSDNDADVTGAIWLSSDHGHTWELSTAEAPPVTADLAARDDLLVAVGRPPQADGAQIWTSRDAMHWQRASADALEHAILAGVAATEDRFLVVGTRQNDDTTTSAMTWESTDGITWKATAVATPGRFGDVVAGPPALVAGGDLGQGTATFDHSVMLAAQTFNLNQVHGPQPLSVTAVASGPLGIVLSAQGVPDDLQSSTWFLPKGSGADAVKTDPIPGMQDLVALPDRFIALSHCADTALCTARSFLFLGQPLPAEQPSQEASPSAEAASSPTATEIPRIGDVTGTFVGISRIPPNCNLLITDAGVRWEVEWPQGYRVEFPNGGADPVLIGPDGSVVARGGDRIAVQGHVDEARGSWCMLTPNLFFATAVSTVTPKASPSIWQWQEPPNYSFDVLAECGERNFLGSFHIEVVHRAVKRVTGLDDRSRRTDPGPGSLPTIGQMLERARQAEAQTESSVAISQTDDGRPTSISIDWLVGAVDDEECYSITNYSAQ